jgi:hypothetical protein
LLDLLLSLLLVGIASQGDDLPELASGDRKVTELRRRVDPRLLLAPETQSWAECYASAGRELISHCHGVRKIKGSVDAPFLSQFPENHSVPNVFVKRAVAQTLTFDRAKKPFDLSVLNWIGEHLPGPRSVYLRAF